MKKGHYSGTVAHSNMSHHGGKVAGAGQLTFGTGPGKAAMKVKVTPNLGINKDSGANSYKPKGMKTYSKGC